MILGYQASNRSIGEEWMLLEVGMTVLEGTKDYRLTRDAISLDTPDGKTIPLPSVTEQRQGNPSAIQQRAKVQRDSINYFPSSAHRACALLFFPDLGSRALPYDDVDLSSDRACVGRLYFRIPGGIAYGQHWLNVKFQDGLVRVPFRILTKDEEKLLSKNYKSIKQQVKDAFTPKVTDSAIFVQAEGPRPPGLPAPAGGRHRIVPNLFDTQGPYRAYLSTGQYDTSSPSSSNAPCCYGGAGRTGDQARDRA